MKTIRYFIQLLTVVLLIGCSEDELVKSGNSVRIFAEMPSTRITYTSDGNAVQASWNKGDEICLYKYEHPWTSVPYNASQDGKNTEFIFEGSSDFPNPLSMKEDDVVYACYPSCAGDDYLITLPSIQKQYYNNTLDGTDWMYAKGVVENNQLSLQFKHIYSFLQITIPVDLLEESEQRGLAILLNPLKSFIPTGFDLKEGKFTWYDQDKAIYYFIPSDTELGGKNEVVCNITIPPLEEGLDVQIYTLFEGGKYPNGQTYYSLGDCLLTKKTPVGGFKAGNVYTLYLNESEAEQTRAEEKNALIAFYQATDGDNWTRNDNWCSDKPVEEWYGIKINNRDGSRVTEIELIRNNVCGQFSDVLKALAPLSSLEKLNLWGNNLRGTIPEEIGNFQSLTLLNLYSNDELTGILPKSIEKLTNLYELNLGMNNFYGEVPNFGEMLNLGRINLIENQFSGEFPDLSKLTKLRSLGLSDNKFTGPLPEIYDDGKGKTGCTYSVDNNLFTGTIPKSHLNWFVEDSYYLRYDVNYNNLSGTLPQELVDHPTFHAHWLGIVGQNPGYGFDRVDLPAHKNTVQCYDDSFLNLGEEYAKNEYTILFRWDPYCGYSEPYPPLIKDLYEHYKSKGLGLAIMTPRKYSYAERSYITELMPDVPFFWEQASNTYDLPADHYNNNPYSGTNGHSMLFDVLATPYFFIVDKSGNVIYYGSGDHYEGTVPQFHHDRDDIYNFVANLFGDDGFVPEASYYTSSDYSKDGEVITMQKATVGKGIDLVFMGEAFVDRDMDTGGKYEQKMQESMECFFSAEPYKTLRNRFNVYAVKVVSPNAEFYTGGKTQHRINQENAVAFEYAEKYLE